MDEDTVDDGLGVTETELESLGEEEDDNEFRGVRVNVALADSVDASDAVAFDVVDTRDEAEGRGLDVGVEERIADGETRGVEDVDGLSNADPEMLGEEDVERDRLGLDVPDVEADGWAD